MNVIKGRARVDRRTKNLVKRLKPNEIAVIKHAAIDKLSAQALVDARARVVVNASASLSEEYPNMGPAIIIEAGILLLDSVGAEILERVSEGDYLEIHDNKIFCRDQLIAEGRILTSEIIEQALQKAEAQLETVLEKFVENTLDYAREEASLLLGDKIRFPVVNTKIKDRHALVVVRGEDYREDLEAIRSYIKEMQPALIGVDGGADALLEFGLRPDIIIGDMDSVSDRALSAAKEIIVHAYKNGRAPGLERVEKLGLPAKIFAVPGTSEDAAMLLAYEKGAEMIAAVGTHSNLYDFLEKGRKGMSSTFLVRLKVGARLIDAKGISQLYRSFLRPRHIALLVLAASLPLIAVLLLAPATREIIWLLYIQARVIFGI